MALNQKLGVSIQTNPNIFKLEVSKNLETEEQSNRVFVENGPTSTPKIVHLIPRHLDHLVSNNQI